MANSIYAGLSRQSGLMREMRVLANNIANSDTTGFRKEGVVFAEYLGRTGKPQDAVSMAHARGRLVDLGQGGLSLTGGDLDIAIEGDGFFMVETPTGPALTRAGAFLLNADGGVVTAEGYPLLDDGKAPVGVPPDVVSISVGADGTLSADGEAVAKIGVFEVLDPADLQHRAGTMFHASGEVSAVEEPLMRQGFLEGSNVVAMTEIARMIEVQRAYELGQSFLNREDERIRSVISSLSR